MLRSLQEIKKKINKENWSIQEVRFHQNKKAEQGDSRVTHFLSVCLCIELNAN